MTLGDRRPGAVGGWLPGKALQRGALAAGGCEIQTAGAGGRWPGWGRGRTRGFLSIASPPHPSVPPEAGLPEKGFLPFPPQVTLKKQNTENKSQLEVSGSWGDCPASSGSFRPGRAPPRTGLPAGRSGALVPRAGPVSALPCVSVCVPRAACWGPPAPPVLRPSGGGGAHCGARDVATASSPPGLRGPGREAEPGTWHPGACSTDEACWGETRGWALGGPPPSPLPLRLYGRWMGGWPWGVWVSGVCAVPGLEPGHVAYRRGGEWWGQGVHMAPPFSHTQTHADTRTESHTDTETQTHIQSHTQTQTHRETPRQTHRHTCPCGTGLLLQGAPCMAGVCRPGHRSPSSGPGVPVGVGDGRSWIECAGCEHQARKNCK